MPVRHCTYLVFFFFFFSSRRRHTRLVSDWSSDVCSSDLIILCQEEERVVARDNTVTIGGRVLQIAPQPGRRSCVGLTVTVRHHLHGGFTIARGTQRLGTFHADGLPVPAAGLPTRANRKIDRLECPRNNDRPVARGVVSPDPHREPTTATV